MLISVLSNKAVLGTGCSKNSQLDVCNFIMMLSFSSSPLFCCLLSVIADSEDQDVSDVESSMYVF